jgi:hypothetical protein
MKKNVEYLPLVKAEISLKIAGDRMNLHCEITSIGFLKEVVRDLPEMVNDLEKLLVMAGDMLRTLTVNDLISGSKGYTDLDS